MTFIKSNTIKRRSVLGLGGSFVLGAAVSACDKLPAIVATIGNIAEVVRKSIGMFKSTMPVLELDEELEGEIKEGLAWAEEALDAFEASAKATGATAAGEQEKARAELLKAYQHIYKLAERAGIFDAAKGVLEGPDKGETPITPEELETELQAIPAAA